MPNSEYGRGGVHRTGERIEVRHLDDVIDAAGTGFPGQIPHSNLGK
jgi:hypothetical protein